MNEYQRLLQEAKENQLEDELDFQLRAAGIASERQFEIPPRKLRYDFRISGEQLLIECQGGIWLPGGGKHVRGAGYEADCKKMIYAQLNGYRIFWFTPGMIHSGEALDNVLGFLHRRIE